MLSVYRDGEQHIDFDSKYDRIFIDTSESSAMMIVRSWQEIPEFVKYCLKEVEPMMFKLDSESDTLRGDIYSVDYSKAISRKVRARYVFHVPNGERFETADLPRN